MGARAIQISNFPYIGVTGNYSGLVLSGGTAEFYVPGGLTAQAVYTAADKTGSTVTSVSLNTAGMFDTEVYFDGILRIRISDADSTLQHDFTDNTYRVDSFPTDTFVDATDYEDGSLDASTINAAITDIGSNVRRLLLKPGTWTIDADVTVPKNITLMFAPGAIASISTTKTLTMNGPLQSEIIKIFTLNGTGTVVFGTGYIEHVYPQYWGAVGDDSTECKTAFQEAVDAYGKVKIPVGTYKITGEIQYPSNTTICGEGRDASVLHHYQSSTDQYLFDVVTKTNCHFKTFKIDSNQDQNNDMGIRVQDSTHCVIEDVYYANGSFGFYLINSDETPAIDYSSNYGHSIINCVVDSVQETGFTLSGVTKSDIISCKAYSCGTDGFKVRGYGKWNSLIDNYAEGCTRDGFDLFNGFLESIVSGNISQGNTLYGFEVKGTFDATLGDHPGRDSIFSNNMAIGNTDFGFNITGIKNMTISGNHAVSNSKSGFQFATTQGLAVTGCTASKNAQHGFVFQAAANTSRMMLTGCLAVDNSWDDGATQNGFYNGFHLEDSGGNGMEFIGCRALNRTIATQRGGQGYGMACGQTATCSAGITGTFQDGEDLSFSSSGATGTFHRETTTTIIYTITSGTPTTADTISGDTSGASGVVTSLLTASGIVVDGGNLDNNVDGDISAVEQDQLCLRHVNSSGYRTYLEGEQTLNGGIRLVELSSTPTNPTQDTEGQLYFKSNKLIFRHDDGGTLRYKYLDLTGTGVTWVHTTSAP